MPRGAKPGERRGGRARGTPNKLTIKKQREAAEIASRAITDARESGKPLAKEVLDQFMQLFAGMAAHYQPLPDGVSIVPPGRNPNPDLFHRYADLAIDCAHKLAPYQSPTFKAIALQTTAVTPEQPVEARQSAQVIDLSTDVVAAQARYMRLIKRATS